MWRSSSCHQRCQKQTAFWQFVWTGVNPLSHKASWAKGVSLPDALQWNQIQNLSRYTPAGICLIWTSNSTEVPLRPHGLLLLPLHCSLLAAWRALFDIWKCFLLTSNCLGYNFPFFHFCHFCVSCIRYTFLNMKSNFIRLLQGLNELMYESI